MSKELTKEEWKQYILEQNAYIDMLNALDYEEDMDYLRYEGE